MAAAKNARPVRVYTAPVVPSPAPNLLAPTWALRQTRTTAREPMCFSWQITCGTPLRR